MKWSNYIPGIFFTRRLYGLLAINAFVFVLSYALTSLFIIAGLLLGFLLLAILMDMLVLFFQKKSIDVERKMADKFSNGDDNTVELTARSKYLFTIGLQIIDEVPDQFQQRAFSIKTFLKEGEEKNLPYSLRPVERGEYVFNNINLLVTSPLKLVIRKMVVPAAKTITVLPSFHHLRKYELKAHATNLSEAGNEKLRKIGHSLEFEQIKEYVTGDDIRSINWKATARKGGQLMVNNYTDERSQQVYCIIDKSRVMKMPFGGMTLLDYAINASLVLLQVALIKQDKAGLITFAENIGDVLPADRKAMQMNNILDILYKQKTQFLESDFEMLHALLRTRINQRSFVVLFTNFESMSGLQRQLPYLRSIARNHLLLVVFFENTGLKSLTENDAANMEEVYIKTIAEKFVQEKRIMVKELQRHGILAILTEPQQLTVNTVNKYLEIKAKQAI